MLNFGLALGKGAGLDKCRPVGELWANPDFLCGLKYWNPNHQDTQLVDNGDGTVTVSNTGDWAYASLMPDNVSIEPGEYILTLDVTDMVGPGKASYRVGSSWTDVIHYDTTGIHKVSFTLNSTTDNWSIGASGDKNAVITYNKVSLRPLVEPDWYKIDTLDEADIIAAFDFAWEGHNNRSEALTDLVNGISATIEEGNPNWAVDKGLSFGGGASISFDLPDGLSDMEISTVIQISNASRNGALDAYFGWFSNDGSRYILQQSFDNDVFRWSAGQGSDPVEAGPTETEGIAGTSGDEFYANGNYLGTSQNGTPVLTSSQKMYVGGAFINGSIQQHAKFTGVKLLVVKRKLTADEQKQLAERMQ